MRSQRARVRRARSVSKCRRLPHHQCQQRDRPCRRPCRRRPCRRHPWRWIPLLRASRRPGCSSRARRASVLDETRPFRHHLDDPDHASSSHCREGAQRRWVGAQRRMAGAPRWRRGQTRGACDPTGICRAHRRGRLRRRGAPAPPTAPVAPAHGRRPSELPRLAPPPRAPRAPRAPPPAPRAPPPVRRVPPPPPASVPVRRAPPPPRRAPARQGNAGDLTRA